MLHIVAQGGARLSFRAWRRRHLVLSRLLHRCDLIRSQKSTARPTRPPHRVVMPRLVEIRLPPFTRQAQLLLQLLPRDAPLEYPVELLRIDVQRRLLGGGYLWGRLALRLVRRHGRAGHVHDGLRGGDVRAAELLAHASRGVHLVWEGGHLGGNLRRRARVPVVLHPGRASLHGERLLVHGIAVLPGRGSRRDGRSLSRRYAIRLRHGGIRLGKVHLLGVVGLRGEDGRRLAGVLHGGLVRGRRDGGILGGLVGGGEGRSVMLLLVLRVGVHGD